MSKAISYISLYDLYGLEIYEVRFENVLICKFENVAIYDLRS
jgi:hypothetical protein